LLAIAAIGLILNTVWIARNWHEMRPISSGDIAPEFVLPSIDQRGNLGAPVSLSSQRGKVVLIDFWATWCGPCMRSMPAIEAVYRKLRDRGFTVLSINTDGSDETAAARRAVARTSFPLLVDDGVVQDMYKVRTIPHLVLVDRLGVVRHVHRGSSRSLERSLTRQVTALLERAQ
jgi:thiol-disulfide isomerase/thioredoxin